MTKLLLASIAECLIASSLAPESAHPSKSLESAPAKDACDLKPSRKTSWACKWAMGSLLNGPQPLDIVVRTLVHVTSVGLIASGKAAEGCSHSRPTNLTSIRVAMIFPGQLPLLVAAFVNAVSSDTALIENSSLKRLESRIARHGFKCITDGKTRLRSICFCGRRGQQLPNLIVSSVRSLRLGASLADCINPIMKSD